MIHPTSNAWCVYILSNNAHTLYVGSTNDLLRRLEEHKAKTKPEIKGWTRAKKVVLIENGNPNWIDLTPRVLDLLRLNSGFP